MSLAIPQDTTLENRRRAWRRLLSRCRQTIPYKWASRDALRHIIESTLSVAIPTVKTPTSIPNQPTRTIDKPQDTTLTNRHRSSKRRQKIPYTADMSIVKAQDKTHANWHRASQHLSSRLKSPYIMYMSLRKPQDTTLATAASWRRRLKIPYKVYMSPGKLQDETMAQRCRESRSLSRRRQTRFHKQRAWAQESHKTRHCKNDAERCNACRQEAESRFMTPGKPHDASKPTPSAARPIIAKQTQDATGSEHEPGKPRDTTLANRRQRRNSSRRNADSEH
jgi:hypothetical protein